jgi:hypothetical protein
MSIDLSGLLLVLTHGLALWAGWRMGIKVDRGQLQKPEPAELPTDYINEAMLDVD